jgi:hypothetical protein
MHGLPRLAARSAPAPLALRLGDSASKDISFLRGVSGGIVSADVLRHTEGTDFFARKQLGEVHNEAFAVGVRTPISSGLFDWLAASWGDAPPAHDGAILACEYDYTIKDERGFVDALVQETAFPALDAATKQTIDVTVALAPRVIHEPIHPNTSLSFPLGPMSKQKLWLASNFLLHIDGLDCTKVSRIEPFAIRRRVEIATSGSGTTTLQAGNVDFPNLRITFSASSVMTWAQWHKSFVVDGQNGPGFERTGRISFFSVSFQELVRIELNGLGIFRLTMPEEDAEHSSAVQRVIADVYCERMVLKPGGAP